MSGPHLKISVKVELSLPTADELLALAHTVARIMNCVLILAVTLVRCIELLM